MNPRRLERRQETKEEREVDVEDEDGCTSRFNLSQVGDDHQIDGVLTSLSYQLDVTRPLF